VNEVQDIQYPDGKGGYTTIKGEKFTDGAQADPKKMEKVMDQVRMRMDRIKLIADAAQDLNKMHLDYADEQGLNAEELVASLSLELYNCREFFPDDLGGPARFDKITEEIYEWFQEQLNG
jgi:hypothetical protein